MDLVGPLLVAMAGLLDAPGLPFFGWLITAGSFGLAALIYALLRLQRAASLYWTKARQGEARRLEDPAVPQLQPHVDRGLLPRRAAVDVLRVPVVPRLHAGCGGLQGRRGRRGPPLLCLRGGGALLLLQGRREGLQVRRAGWCVALAAPLVGEVGRAGRQPGDILLLLLLQRAVWCAVPRSLSYMALPVVPAADPC